MTSARGKEILDPIRIEEALAELPGWEYKAGRFERVFLTKSFMAGLEFVQAIAPVAEEMNHHPDVILTYPKVKVQAWTHTVNGVTELDVDLAKAINRKADEEGVV